MINRAELKSDAKNALRGKWGLCIGVELLYQAIFIGAALIIVVASIFTFKDDLIKAINFVQAPLNIVIALFSPAFMLGLVMLFLQISRNENSKVSTLFAGFSNFWKAFGLYFMISLFTLLWALLLYIPGIIAMVRYSMAFYILADNPNIGVMEAIRKSKRMTKGNKWDIFVLGLSFIGWGILALLTGGIGFLWLYPYIETTFAHLYIKLNGELESIEALENFVPAQ